MFRYLGRKIRTVIIAILALCVVLSALLSFIGIKNIILGNYKELSIKYTEHQFETANLYLKLIEETSRLVTQDPELISTLTSPEFDRNIVSILNGTRSTKLSILGLSLFSENGQLYNSSGLVSNSGRLDFMKEDTGFIEFMSSSLQTKWYMQFDKDNRIYKPSIAFPYSGSVLTLVSKIKGPNGDVLGYLFIDTDANYYYQLFKQPEDSLFKYTDVFLLTGDKRLLSSPYNNSQVLDPDLLKKAEYVFEEGGNQVLSGYEDNLTIFNKITGSDILSIIRINLTSAYGLIATYSFAVILLSALLIIISVRVSKTIEESITIPITELHSKMHGSIKVY